MTDDALKRSVVRFVVEGPPQPKQRANAWTDAQISLLRRYYTAAGSGHVDLVVLAQLIGRDKANVCRKARSLGLTNAARPKPEAYVRSMAERSRAHIAANGHPRGALGMRHTAETLAVMAAKTRAAWADPSSGLNRPEDKQRRSNAMMARQASGELRQGYSRALGGRRADLGNTYFRSSWEANYARYLNLLQRNGAIAGWQYEAQTFVFEKIKRGTRSYTPDFKVAMENGSHEWHEVKGWMDQASKTRLARMGKYYPDERVIVIGANWFTSAKHSGLSASIPGWESKRK